MSGEESRDGLKWAVEWGGRAIPPGLRLGEDRLGPATGVAVSSGEADKKDTIEPNAFVRFGNIESKTGPGPACEEVRGKGRKDMGDAGDKARKEGEKDRERHALCDRIRLCESVDGHERR
jgi:hypothetical protein